MRGARGRNRAKGPAEKGENQETIGVSLAARSRRHTSAQQVQDFLVAAKEIKSSVWHGIYRQVLYVCAYVCMYVCTYVSLCLSIYLSMCPCSSVGVLQYEEWSRGLAMGVR
jgi:hypothetical protein